MATFYSDQIALARNATLGQGNSFGNGILDTGGKQRVAFFSVLTTGTASGDVLNLVTLPKGARILAGRLLTEALGASVTLSVGTDQALTQPNATVAAGAANLLAATSVASASQTDFAATYALGQGALANDANTTVYATVGGATPTTAKQISGYVEYLQN